jgi:hypothetical protein
MRTVGEWGSFNFESLETEDLDDLSVEAIGEDLQALFRFRNAVDAQIQRRLVRFENGEGYAGDGCLSAKAWLRWKCHLTFSAASQRVEVARTMQSLELTGQAMAEGHISYDHASMIARTAERLGEKFEGPAEAILVELARKEDPVILRRAIVHLRHCVEPDGVLQDSNEEHERRFLHLSQTFGGMFVLNGQFGADDGATLQTALDALMTPPAADDERKPSERRADALTEMARRQLDGGQLPMVGGQKPHLMVSVEMATLTHEPGSRAAELEWSQPIPAETARRIACDCALTPIVDGEPQGTGRVVPGSMRRALVVRDKRCRFPGCDIPASWTDAHHIRHWADGGPTKLWNLILLCRRHHRLVHEGRWQLVGAGDNVLQAVPP